MKLTSATVSKLMVGSNAATKAYLGAVEVWSAIDPAITAFATASGATDLVALSNLAAYLRSQSLLSSVRCYPFKSAQNAGSGSTVYGWGDLTTNNCTLVNSPTWGAGGVALDGTSQYATITDFTGNQTLTVFCRATIAAKAGTSTHGIMTQWGTSAGQRSWLLGSNTDASQIRMLRTSDGTSTNQERYDGSDSGIIGNDVCISAQWVSGSSGRSLSYDSNDVTLSLFAGTAQTARYDSPNHVAIGAVFDGTNYGAHAPMLVTASMVIVGNLTAAQSLQIRTLINAL